MSSRTELQLERLLGKDVDVPNPQSRVEELLEQLNETLKSGGSGGSSSPVKYLESTSDAPVSLRSLDSGSYVLSGSFTPYDGAEDHLTFLANMIVLVDKNFSASCVQVFYPMNNTIQYLEISDTEFIRSYAKLSFMESISNKVTSIDETADDYNYPSAKAVKDYIDTTFLNGSW